MARGRFQQQQWEQRAEAIVEALERLCAARGFGAVTMDALADDVGISKATLYQHFDSKDALLSEMMKRHLDRFLAALAGTADQPPVERLCAAVRVLMDGHLSPLQGLGHRRARRGVARFLQHAGVSREARANPRGAHCDH